MSNQQRLHIYNPKVKFTEIQPQSQIHRDTTPKSNSPRYNPKVKFIESGGTTATKSLEKQTFISPCSWLQTLENLETTFAFSRNVRHYYPYRQYTPSFVYLLLLGSTMDVSKKYATSALQELHARKRRNHSSIPKQELHILFNSIFNATLITLFTWSLACIINASFKIYRVHKHRAESPLLQPQISYDHKEKDTWSGYTLWSTSSNKRNLLERTIMHTLTSRVATLIKDASLDLKTEILNFLSHINIFLVY